MAKPLEEFERWYDGLPRYLQSSGPARGSITAALVVLARLQDAFDLSLQEHMTRGGAQVRGMSGPAVKKILAGFGEDRELSSEGGRTNRGARSAIEALLDRLRESGIERLPQKERAALLKEMQGRLVAKIDEWHGRKRLTFSYDRSKTTWQAVRELLDEARKTGKEGPAAQYLVGAKLQLRFPELAVENFSFSTADAPSGRVGDFLLGDTVFHVTVSPMSPVFEKCVRNLADGLSVYLVVPFDRFDWARQSAEEYARGRIFVASVEQFVGCNINEMSSFRASAIAGEFRKLLETYNRRVAEVERDQSLLIEIPRALAQTH